MDMYSGLFVTFEGPEGCGKTTQGIRLRDRLVKMGLNIVATREPGGTPISDKIRELVLDPNILGMILETEVLLFAASRAQLVQELLLPSLYEGKIVLCDRYADSTLAYQGYGQGIPLEKLKLITEFATKSLIPDVTFLLDLPVEVGLSRRLDLNEKQTLNGPRQLPLFNKWDRLDVKGYDFHQRVREGYKVMMEEEMKTKRWIMISAMGSPDDVEEKIWKSIKPILIERKILPVDLVSRDS
jgi:dTMP kinase